MTLTPEKLDELERALKVKLDAEKRLRANLTSKNLAALDAADAQLGVLLDDNAEELVRAVKERDAQAAKLAKVQELRGAIEAFMRSPQKKDDKARAWEFGNCIAYIKNGLDAIIEGDEA